MIKTAKELANACERIAKNNRTLYVLGCIGSPMTPANKTRYKNAQSYNRRNNRKVKIDAATADTFGFDCVCLVKSLLWGWDGNTDKVYGGATYASNGVPDIDANAMIRKCSEVSTDFTKIAIGEALWMQDHFGVYIGNGLAVECTPKWDDGVQITAVHNIEPKLGYNGRKWVKHGKLPYVKYEAEPEAPAPKPSPAPAPQQRGLPVVKYGSRGATAKALQILLIGFGYSCGGYGADGVFGVASINGLKKFQKNNGLVADGICGVATWSKLIGNMPVIKYGSRGSVAKSVQILLAGYGFSCGASGSDGIFGNASLGALKKYQKASGLVADGICGKATWSKLLGLR